MFQWEELPIAIRCGAEGSFDGYDIYHMDVFVQNQTWYMFYTGSNRGEKGLIQRIGLATSDDLIHWTRHPANPLIEADAQWYELLDLNLWHDQAWRDPWVFEHDGRYHAYITARSNHGDKTGRGVIGHATSPDLIHWTVQPPVTEPGEFGYLEVPQLTQIAGRWYLFFSVTHDKYALDRLAKPGIKPQTGSHYLVADHPLGPFEFISVDFLVGDEIGSLYSGKVLRNPRGSWVFVAFRLFGPGNQFFGELADPLPLQVLDDGRLAVPRMSH
jgi:beta-fructofuranosidase